MKIEPRYIADDGRIFDTEDECLAYEKTWNNIKCYDCEGRRMPIEMDENFAAIVTYIDSRNASDETVESFYGAFKKLCEKYRDKFGEPNMADFESERGRMFWNPFEARWEVYDYNIAEWKHAIEIFEE